MLIKFYNKYKFGKWCDENSIASKNPHYYKLFKKFIDSGESTKDIISLYDKLTSSQNVKYLEKNPTTYTNSKGLLMDINIINSILVDLKPSPYNKIFQSFSTEDKKRFIRILEIVDIDLYPKHIKYISDFLKEYKFSFENPNISKYQKLIKDISLDNGETAKLIYDLDNTVILEIFGPDSIKKFGSPKWCLKHSDNWNEYVGTKKKQYVIYNFDYHYDHDDHIIGMTIRHNKCDNCKSKSKSKVKWVFDKDNSELYCTDDGKFSKSNLKDNIDTGTAKYIYKVFNIIHGL